MQTQTSSLYGKMCLVWMGAFVLFILCGLVPFITVIVYYSDYIIDVSATMRDSAAGFFLIVGVTAMFMVANSIVDSHRKEEDLRRLIQIGKYAMLCNFAGLAYLIFQAVWEGIPIVGLIFEIAFPTDENQET